MTEGFNPLLALEWLEWKAKQKSRLIYISLGCSSVAIIFSFISAIIGVAASIIALFFIWKAHDIGLPLRKRWLELEGWRRRKA